MRILIFVSVSLLFSICKAQTCKSILRDYDLVWQDEFDGRKLDTSKWNYRGTGSKRGIGIVRKENCYLDGDGHFVIEATKQDTNYYIGQIATFNKAEFKYGYFEARVKLTTQLGPATAFWLQSLVYGQYLGDPGRSGTEVDILEYRRKYEINEVHHTVHWDGYAENHKQDGKSTTRKGIENGFHTYGLEWTDKKYTFYIDGKKSWSTKKAISNRPLYIILSVELNNWSGDPSETTFPDKALYDYVRVYQKKKPTE